MTDSRMLLVAKKVRGLMVALSAKHWMARWARRSFARTKKTAPNMTDLYKLGQNMTMWNWKG
jgi:hypothetical protein